MMNFWKIWWNLEKKVKNSIKKKFDSEPGYNEKFLKSKIKSCNGKIITNFHNNKMPKECCQFICSSLILTDSVCRTGKNYYPGVFLEKCKFFVKDKKDPIVYYWWYRHFFWWFWQKRV